MVDQRANWLRLVVMVLVGLGCCKVQAGYTHYFTWHQEPWTTNNPPETGVTNVAFNGLGDNAHEPFVFPGAVGFNFCKTAYKPYDEVVTACLLVAHDHFSPNVLEINSDGSWEDWDAGAKLYRSVFGHRPNNPFAKPTPEVSATVFWRNFGISLVLIGVVIASLQSRRWVA